MPSCNNLSLSSGQTPYIAVNGVSTNFSTTLFGVNGIIHVGNNCTGSTVSDGYYYDGTDLVYVNGGFGKISLVSSPTFYNYEVIECGEVDPFVLSASTEVLNQGSTYLVGFYDPTLGFFQKCVTVVEPNIATSGYQQYSTSVFTINCRDCNTRLSCVAGIVNAGDYVFYHDCCGNFYSYQVLITQTINLNPALSHSSNIITFPTTSLITCPTPTPSLTPNPTPSITPTNTITPTTTPTVTPTPSFTPQPTPVPVFIYDNSCNVIVSYPMGLRCQTTNASGPTTNNGSVSVIVTGGTSPYTYYWNTGARSSTINNLLPGSYTCTVVDYYGDYTGTTTCVVTAPKLVCEIAGSATQI